jgi:hypothetical protein
VRAAAPADSARAPAAAAPPSAAAASAKSAPTPGSEEVADQVSATTSVRPLPTLPPTLAPVPTQAPARLVQPFAATETTPQDPAAPLRVAAAIVGILAAFGVLTTLVVRHRLRAASTSFTE